ncbi:MAG TPA: hypothetical protein VFU16_02785 [Solirubrobacterales bacterium]|nr:hypothetical protein [Solirubrobacterales bacterium]
MTTLTRSWRQPAPTRNGLAELPPPDPKLWESRISQDRARVAACQSKLVLSITREIESRSHDVGAHALVLTGSTARDRRTRVSDLDYQVIGEKPEISGLPSDIDLYGDEPDLFLAKMFKGDDFAHWALRYGCILFDDGALRKAAIAAIEHDLWPDPERKLRQAKRAVEFSQKLLPTGDYAALLEVSRGAFSLAARWWLISHDVFPLARDELAQQLVEVDQPALARALEETIHRRPTAATIASWLDQLSELTSA